MTFSIQIIDVDKIAMRHKKNEEGLCQRSEFFHENHILIPVMGGEARPGPPSIVSTFLFISRMFT